MKRILALLLLSVSTLWGQFLPDIPDRLSYVGSFNGSSQYFSKTSPVSMDLNGSELGTNVGFETYSSPNFTGWARDVAGTTTVDTSYQSRTGNYAVKIVTDGSNNVGQVTQYVSVTAGLKYTFEVWHKVAGGADSIQYMLYDSTNNKSWVQSSQTWSAGAITSFSASSGTYAKTVANFVAQPGAINIQIRLTRKGTEPAGSTFIFDDVSLTRAWDAVAVYRVKTSQPSGTGTLFHGGTGSNYLEMQVTPNRQNVKLADGTTTTTLTGASIPVNDGRERTFAFTLNRTGSLVQHVYGGGDAGTSQSITSIGKIAIGAFYIGTFGGTINFYDGSLGELLIVRYASLPSDIASWIAFANTQRFIPEPPGGGTTVLRLFGRENSAYDQSGTQGVLTNTGNTPIIPR